MALHVHCECGEHIPVSEGAAGGQVDCRCGRTLAVPTLAELRKQAGLPAHKTNAALLIEMMIADGALPTATTTTCACCDQTTGDTATVTAECETVSSNEQSELVLPISVALFGIIGVFGALVRPRKTTEHGNYVVLPLPVRMCLPCQQRLATNPVSLLLRTVAFVFLAAALFIAIAWTAWGLPLLVGSLLALVLDGILRKRRHTELKKWVAREPMYQQLFEKYPHAQLTLNAGE